MHDEQHMSYFSMRVVVISDTHGNIERIKHVLRFAKEIKAGAIVHCGDWDNTLAIKTVTSFGIPLYGVLGNADISPQMVDAVREFCEKSDEDFLEFELDGKKIGVCHFPDRIKDIDKDTEHERGIIFYGHTHKSKGSWAGKTRLVNPGALARTDQPSFVVYDTKLDNVQFIDVKV